MPACSPVAKTSVQRLRTHREREGDEAQNPDWMLLPPARLPASCFRGSLGPGRWRPELRRSGTGAPMGRRGC